MEKWLGKILDQLANKQSEIDEYIHKKRSIHSEKTFLKRIVALFTELSEFVNEDRSFKYWSIKKASERAVLLEEYSDCIHFLLSIGNEIGFKWIDYKVKINSYDNDITLLMLNSYVSLALFSQEQNKENFKKFLDNFFSIAKKWEFSKTELLESYINKNKKNYSRQESNY